METDTDRYRQMQTDTDTYRQMHTDIDRHRQMQTDTDRCRQSAGVACVHEKGSVSLWVVCSLWSGYCVR